MWPSHPGPIFIQVIEGQVTFYERPKQFGFFSKSLAD